MATEPVQIDVAATVLEWFDGRADGFQLAQDLLELQSIAYRIGGDEDDMWGDGMDLAQGHTEANTEGDGFGRGIGDKGTVGGWGGQDEGQAIEGRLGEDGEAEGEIGDEDASEEHGVFSLWCDNTEHLFYYNETGYDAGLTPRMESPGCLSSIEHLFLFGKGRAPHEHDA